MKKLVSFALILMLVSCKTKAVIAESVANDVLSAEKIINNHNANKVDFSTVYIKSDVDYDNGKQSYSVSAEIKIKKDQIILVSVRFLGITMAKALITPQSVKYYEKINSTYFEGDYQSLSQWLGTDLDFQKVQNMLVGLALDDLSKSKFTATLEDGLYKLQNTKKADIDKSFYFEAANFLVKKQEINQISQNRMLQILYKGFNQYPEANLPSGMTIEANQEKGKTNIDIEYKSVIFNEELSFPYNVPDSYKQIFIH